MKLNFKKNQCLIKRWRKNKFQKKTYDNPCPEPFNQKHRIYKNHEG